MAVSVVLTQCYNVSEPKATALVHDYFSRNNNRSRARWRNRYSAITCCSRRKGERANKEKNYYELLGVPVEANVQEIKEAYRKLQKKYLLEICL